MSGSRSRIGVIGGGVSGMAAAWLLQHDHDVTLFERAPTLGGHVETIAVESGGKTVHAELGPRFFFDSAYPYYLTLLRLLQVPTRWTAARVSFTDVGRRHTLVLPPRSIRQTVALLRSPRLLRHALSLRRLVEEQAVVSHERDGSVTFRQHLAAAGYPSSFGPEFAYPFLSACWGVSLAQLAEFPVYGLLKGMPPGRRPGFHEIVGGVASYVRAFAGELSQVEIRVGSGVRRVAHDGRYRVEDERGEVHAFDQLVVATSSCDAARLLHDVPFAAAMRRAVGRFRQFETDIVIHGDATLMPPDRRDWSHNNLFLDGDHAWMSDWQGLREDVPVFRTWLPEGRPLPRPLYGRRKYEHLVMTRENARWQRHIAALQGAAGLWVTGMYTVDIDNHESALLSALVPARALAPQSPNLARLLQAVPSDAPHGLEVLPVPLPQSDGSEGNAERERRQARGH